MIFKNPKMTDSQGPGSAQEPGRVLGPDFTSGPSGDPKGRPLTRRSFLSLLGWAWLAFVAAALGGLGLLLRFIFPNVTREPNAKFKVGLPGIFSRGVDERFKDSHRVWIVRDQQGFYALSAVCTHLGCTPDWQSSEGKFKCPCHGSGFYMTGVNFEGPAPRPLSRYRMSWAEDGQIEVDTSVEYRQEKGQWGQEGSFLKY
jgi:cytochrome b6-f complex iron-sulfur subunit